MFEIKDSGKRKGFSGGMVRDVAEGKIDYSLIADGPMLKRWAVHLTNGAKKYAKRNWMKATGDEEYQRFRESAFRHFNQYMNGDTDEDHASAVFFNINGMEFLKQKACVGKGIAWAAGIFEGEGSIVIRKSKGSVQVTLYNTDKDVIDSFYDIVKVGKIFGPIHVTTPKGNPGKDSWQWRAYSTDAEKVLKLLLPYFCSRRAQKAQEAIDFQNRPEKRRSSSGMKKYVRDNMDNRKSPEAGSGGDRAASGMSHLQRGVSATGV
jgi:hypothetical protein